MAKKKVYWYTLADPKINANKLQEDLSCDVVVIGGGMAGLMCAQELQSAGKSVIVLEKTFVGGGASGKSSGFITPDSELELYNLHDDHGAEAAKKLWEFAKGGVGAIKTNITTNNFECDYQVQDSLFVAASESDLKTVQHEHEVQQKLGYESILYNSEQVSKVVGSHKYYGGIRYGETFGMTSFLYCQELKKLLMSNGVKIFENTEVTEIQDKNAITPEGKVTAESIIVCADYQIGKLEDKGKEVYHAQTFLGITRPLTQSQIEYIFPKDKLMVWDTELIYQYYRLTGDNRLLMGGSNILYTYESHTAFSTTIIRRKLQKYLHHNFPKLANVDFEYLWPGLIGVSKDFLPVAGQSKSSGIYYVGGAAGLPWAAALGKYIGQKVCSGRSDMDKYFSAERNFVLGRKTQSLLGKPITFALAHGYEKFGP